MLHTHRIGEMHKGVVFLSPDLGILRAIAHGAYRGKNRLGSSTDLFCRSRMYVYHQPVKDSYKITDVVPRDPHEPIRTDVRRFVYASVWAETVLKAFAGGEDFDILFSLLSGSLDALSSESEDRLDLIMIQFMYRFLVLIGFMPDPDECISCSARIPKDTPLYVGRRPAFLCAACAGENMPCLTTGARRYFEHTGRLSLNKAFVVGLDSASISTAREALFALIEGIIERPLNSVRTTGGLL